MIFVTPTQDDTLTALRAVLLAALPAGTGVYLGQVNQAPEPAEVNYVIMTPLRRRRIETNVDGLDDCKFLGSIAGTALTVTAVDLGALTPNRELFGQNVAAGTIILGQVSGPTGGAGTYLVSIAQTLAAQVLACGVTDVVGPYMLDVQLDFHGAGGSSAPADAAQTVATLFRDLWAVGQFETQSTGSTVTPLYTDDPKQIPFIDGQDQYEDRWVVEATLQVNETISVPQEYMDSAAIGLIEVDTTYPA